MSDLHPFGRTFKELREKRGLSLKEAAGSIVSPQFLSQFEKEEKGISVENFSRLLISIGVTWEDFAFRYQGDSIDYYLQVWAENRRQQVNSLEFRQQFNEQMGDYVKDNPELKQLMLDLVAYMFTDYSKGSNLDRKKEIEERMIHHLKKITFLNVLEHDLHVQIFQHCSYELNEKMTQFYLDTYKTTKSFDTAIQSLLNLGFMIDYFSEKGYYLKAGTLAEEIKNFPHPAKHFLVRELCRIEMRAVYNLLRQNDKSAIPRARNIITYLEADTNLIPTEANMRRLIEFREIFNKLNKTGIDLTDSVGHRY
ncbi:TPA: helix-turn-helix transcriptional regulator [Streptococcus suis]|nr:helix-turn-helix transcriptional regulator [Streptococcus suis]